jgi:hypothetical protein
MKISCGGELKNNTFLVWSDNGKPLRFSEESGIRRLQRDWKITAFNSNFDSVVVETDMMVYNEIKPLREGEIFWLMIDRSGTGKYPPGQTAFIPGTPALTGRNILFRKVIFDSDLSGADVFTIVTAPSFFARNVITPPVCQPLQTGEIETCIGGGNPPFEIMLNGITDSRFHVLCMENRREHVFREVSQGEYILIVKDSKNNTYSEKIWVSNSSSWKTGIAGYYNISDGEIITLDASEGMAGNDFIYSWTMPDGSEVNNETITISEAGYYLLSVTDANNCNSARQIRIEESGNPDFRMVDLFPNPVSGLFTLRVMLEQQMDVNVKVTDVNGKILKQILLQNDSFYRYSDVIKLPGIYFITLISKKEKMTLTLIVR